MSLCGDNIAMPAFELAFWRCVAIAASKLPSDRGMASSIAAGKDATAQEGAFQRIVAMVTAAAAAGHFAGCIETRYRLAFRVQHLAVQIGVQPAQRLARQDVQPDGDRGPCFGSRILCGLVTRVSLSPNICARR